MAQRPRLRFRGVVLYVKRQNGLDVYFPATAHSETEGEPRKHFPLATKWRDKQMVSAPIDLQGATIRAQSDHDTTHDLKKVFKLPHPMGSLPAVPGTRAAAIVRLSGGSTKVTRDSKHQFQLRKGATKVGDYDYFALEVEWAGDAGSDITVSLEYTDDTFEILVTEDEELILGHYDDPEDAKVQEIKELPGPFVLTTAVDVDFIWLCRMLGPANHACPLPTHDLPDVPTKTSPFTSTCFGGTWP